MLHDKYDNYILRIILLDLAQIFVATCSRETNQTDYRYDVLGVSARDPSHVVDSADVSVSA